jgi:hypothetical protein
MLFEAEKDWVQSGLYQSVGFGFHPALAQPQRRSALYHTADLVDSY